MFLAAPGKEFLMKKIPALLCICLLAVSILCACGKKKEVETQPVTTEAILPTETQTENPAKTKEPMASSELVDIVFKDLRLSVAFEADITVHPMEKDGNVTISFKLNNVDCSYVLEGTTGEIVSKNVPPQAIEVPANTASSMERAVNMAMDSIDGYTGGATNIQAKESDGIIEVTFDWNGSHYIFHYDVMLDTLID